MIQKNIGIVFGASLFSIIFRQHFSWSAHNDHKAMSWYFFYFNFVFIVGTRLIGNFPILKNALFVLFSTSLTAEQTPQKFLWLEFTLVLPLTKLIEFLAQKLLNWMSTKSMNHLCDFVIVQSTKFDRILLSDEDV